MKLLLLFAWGACLFLGFLGYGKLLLRLFQVRDAPWPLSTATGVSFAVAIGGIANLLHLISVSSLVVFVFVGVAFAFLVDWRHVAGLSTTLLRTPPLYAPLLIALAIPVLGNVRAEVQTFSYWDDYPAYLTLPQETLQLGSLPFDPFNERRVTSCLGAPYVLQSLMLVAGDVRSIRFIDVSLGFILYAGLLIAIFRTMALSVPVRIGLASLTLVVPVDRWNASMAILPAALFCALFLVQIHPSLGNRLDWRRAVLLGMTAAAIACLKSNYLPAAILVCVFSSFSWILSGRRAVPLAQGLLCGAVLLLCMIPWMLDMRHKEGTFLFPILGRGYDASAYGIIPLPNGSHKGASSASRWVWLTALPMAAPLLLALAALFVAFRKKIETAWISPLAAFLLAAAVAIWAVASSTGSESMGRYCLPFQLPALLIFLGFLFACRKWLPRNPPGWLLASGAVTSLTLLALAFAFGVRHSGYRKFLEDAQLATAPHGEWFDMHREEDRVHALQSHLPPGERVLARLFVSYPFDFARNQVFVADYSGMAGLPPGVPIDGDPEAMRRYLLSQNIRYLAFDPGRTMLPDDDPGTTLPMLLKGRKDYGRHGWLYMQLKVTDTVQRTFMALAAKCPHLYDDGQVYLLDLRRMG